LDQKEAKMRNTPQRREAKRKEILEGLQEVSDQMAHVTPIEACVRKIAEALIFILEAQCPKKL